MERLPEEGTQEKQSVYGGGAWSSKDTRYPEIRPHMKAVSLDTVVTLSHSSSQGEAQVHFPEVKWKEDWPHSDLEATKLPTCSGCPVGQPVTWEQEKLASDVNWKVESSNWMKI